MSNNSRRLRSALLTGASTAFIAGVGASGALAAPGASTQVTDINNPATSAVSAIGHKSATSVQQNFDDITASVTDGQGSVSGNTNGAQTGNANTVSTNTLQANAQANIATQQIDLSLINATPDLDEPPTGIDGIAALSVQTSASNSVTSTASSNALSVDLDGFQSGGATVAGNAIGAATTVNQASQTVAGTVPGDYATLATAGTSNLATAGNFNAAGTVVVSTLQAASDVGANSISNQNEVGLSLTGDNGNSVASAPLLDSNTVAASTTLNTAHNQIGLQSGDAPAFQGAAVITNAQDTTQSADGLPSGSDASDNTIVATIQGTDPAIDINKLTGSLGVTNNGISSVAAGNVAAGTDATGTTPGNSILIGDNLTFSGVGTAEPGSSIAYDNGTQTQNVAADLAISSTQGNTGTLADPAVLSASAAGNDIGSSVQSIDGGAISLADNSVSASVKGNASSSSLASGENAQGFSGSVAIANQQTNYRTTQTATAGDNEIAAVTGYSVGDNVGGQTQDSTVNATGNTVSASGYGNSANQSIALDAAALDIGAGEVALSGGTGGVNHDGNVSASGGATIANLQSNYAANLSASQSGTLIGIDADSRGTTPTGTSISGSTLSSTNNTAEAVAVANSGGNSLSLASNDVGSGAGIASVQIASSNSSVAASLSNSAVGVSADTHVIDSTLTTSNNLERAIAYGGSVSNALTVESNGLNLDPSASVGSKVAYDASNPLSFSDGVTVDDVSSQPTINAAFGVLSDQSTQSNVTAAANGALVGASVEGNVTSSTVANTDNAYVGAAYGNDAANSAKLSLGNVDTDGFAAIGAIANTQSAGTTGSKIAATAAGDSVVLTSIDDNVSASGVSTSDNAVQALAYGNRATGNVLTVTGNNLDSASATATGVSATPTGVDGSLALATTSSFSVQNAQAAHGNISATQLDNADPALAATSANVLTTIGTESRGTGDVTNATVTSEGNLLTAAATGNSGVSGVSLTGNQIASSTGVQNFQVTDAAISANIGLAGTPGNPNPDDFTYGVTGTGLSFDANGPNSNTFTAGTLNIDLETADLSASEVAYLVGQGWQQTGSTLSLNAVDYPGGAVTDAEKNALLGAGAQLNATVPASLGTPNQGAVTIAVKGDVSGSTLAVDTNTVAGSVTGNTATNSLAVSGTSIADASSSALSTATPLAATADHALSNIQSSEGAALDSTVYSTFALDTVGDAAISDSTLSVSGNSQSSKAVANTATNSVSLAGNDITAGSALSSVQGGDTGSVSSLSNSDISAPAAIDGSSLSLSNNTNTSLAVYNDVTNTSTVSGTNVSVGTGGNAILAATSESPSATAGHVLLNTQTVSTGATVTSEADTSLSNEDQTAATTTGLNNSSATISGNATMAEASSNRASNSLALNGSATQAASSGVVNQQSSGATVTATAQTAAGIALNGDTPAVPAASGSSVTIADNSTTALARANSASNVLNVDAGSSYGTPSSASAGSQLGSGVNTQAQAAVLNSQGNTGAVSAYSQNVNYTVALNSPATGSSSVAGSTVGVTGNNVAAQAYGNSANNTLTLTALNTGTPTAAVVNYQTNSGPISATATTVTFGIGSNGGGSIKNGTFGATGNAVTATAVGNSAVSVIAAR